MENMLNLQVTVNEFGETVIKDLSGQVVVQKNAPMKDKDARYANVVGCGGGLNFGCK